MHGPQRGCEQNRTTGNARKVLSMLIMNADVRGLGDRQVITVGTSEELGSAGSQRSKVSLCRIRPSFAIAADC